MSLRASAPSFLSMDPPLPTMMPTCRWEDRVITTPPSTSDPTITAPAPPTSPHLALLLHHDGGLDKVLDLTTATTTAGRPRCCISRGGFGAALAAPPPPLLELLDMDLRGGQTAVHTHTSGVD